MPAVSKAQQRFFAIAEHEPGKLKGKAPDMTHEQLHDFAATPSKGLPEHVGHTKHDAQSPAPYYGGAARGAYDGCGPSHDGKCACGRMK